MTPSPPAPGTAVRGGGGLGAAAGAGAAARLAPPLAPCAGEPPSALHPPGSAHLTAAPADAVMFGMGVSSSRSRDGASLRKARFAGLTHPVVPSTQGARLQQLYPGVRHKLAAALTAWHPSDRLRSRPAVPLAPGAAAAFPSPLKEPAPAGGSVCPAGRASTRVHLPCLACCPVLLALPSPRQGAAVSPAPGSQLGGCRQSCSAALAQVFDAKSWDALMARSILPKLGAGLAAAADKPGAPAPRVSGRLARRHGLGALPWPRPGAAPLILRAPARDHPCSISSVSVLCVSRLSMQ